MKLCEFYTSRNLAIYTEFRGGARQKRIAAAHGLSESRVKAIVAEVGAALKKGGNDGNT